MFRTAMFLQMAICCVILVVISDRGQVDAQVLHELKTRKMQKLMERSYYNARALIKKEVTWFTDDDQKPGGNCKFTLYRCKAPRKQIIAKKAGPIVVRLCCKQNRATKMQKFLGYFKPSKESKF